MKKWLKENSFILILLLGILFSFGGIFLSVYTRLPDEGGRGGAVAVALALVSLFVTRNHGAEIYKEILGISKEIQELETNLKPETALKIKLNALEAKLNFNAQILKEQNIYLGISTGIGTVCWGFGDWFAVWILSYISSQN